MEQAMRLAAEDINNRLSVYDERYPDKQFEDKIAFVTLNETVSRILTVQKYSALSAELSSLDAEIVSYLKDAEK